MSSPTQQQSTPPDYLSMLGLDRAPFLDQIDDHFFYADPVLIQRLDLLQHLTRFGDMLLGISGPSGSGKTTLLRQFLQRGNSTWRSCLIDGGKVQQPTELLTRLAEGFGQNMTATPERIKADVIRYWQGLQHSSQQAVIVIEDAHLLPDPALKTLLELDGDAHETLKLARVLMFSEPGLEQRLIAAGLHSPQQPLLHSLDIPRFNEQQTAAYLMYRLAVAGFSGDSPFSLTEIRALHKAAAGLPGKLNTLAHETLIERANRSGTRKQAKPTPNPVDAAAPPRPRARSRTLALLSILLILGVVGYFLRSGALQPWLDKLDPEQTTALEIPAPMPIEPLESRTSAAPTPHPDLAQLTETNADAEPTGNLESAIEIFQLTDQKDDNTDSTVPGSLVTRESAVQSDSPSTPEATLENTQIASPSEPAGATVDLRVNEDPDQKVVEAHPESPPAQPGAATEPSEITEKTTRIPPAQEAVASAAASQAPPQPETLGLLDSTWLLGRPPARFTLQLLGVHSEASLKAFVAAHQIPQPVAFFHTEYKGGDWYVLVQGDYPSMTAALGAISTLPAALRKSKPWPRTFASLQADIQKIAP